MNNPSKILMLVAAIVMMATGAFMSFVQDNSIGVVFIALGASFAALSSVFSATAKKKDADDAG